MKTILITMTLFIALSFGMIATSTNYIQENNNTQELLTFDGYEGGYFIFSDSNHKAVLFETENETSLYNYDLINGDYIGKKFNVVYENPNETKAPLPIENIQKIEVVNTETRISSSL